MCDRREGCGTEQLKLTVVGADAQGVGVYSVKLD